MITNIMQNFDIKTLWIPPVKGDQWTAAFNKIKAKHVDFVLCDSIQIQPLLAIELDDRSHQRKDRQDRDIFVDKAFRSAGVPIVHTYSSAGLAEKIDSTLNIKK